MMQKDWTLLKVVGQWTVVARCSTLDEVRGISRRPVDMVVNGEAATLTLGPTTSRGVEWQLSLVWLRKDGTPETHYFALGRDNRCPRCDDLIGDAAIRTDGVVLIGHENLNAKPKAPGRRRRFGVGGPPVA
jgi:hypothetical protein